MKRFAFLFLLLMLAAGVQGCAPSPTPAVTGAPTAATALATATPPQATAQPTVRPTVTPIRTPRASPIQTPGWFDDVILYEIFPRSFRDSNGDGIGDLRGIIQQLDYIKSLGAGAIWLTPIFASPSYHGYDTSDYYKINPDFGTEQDLIDLVREAHKRNIRVLLDFVAAHTSNQHPFFKDAFANPASKYSEFYRWNNDEHTKYDTFFTFQDMPRLNYANSDVQKYMLDVAQYWMTRTGEGDPKRGIDGYRCDYVLNVPGSFWKALRQEVKGLNPDFVLLGEAWTGMADIAPYYNQEFDATFDFPIYGEIEGSQDMVGDSLLLGIKSARTLEGLLIAEQVLFPYGAEHVEFINNHDTNRAMSEVNGDVKRAKLGALLELTLPGTPMIYYGEEIGMKGVKAPAPDYDKARREPMDWYAAETGPGMTTWYKPDSRNNRPNDGISVEEESGKSDSLLEYYRAVAALRSSNSALRTGSREGIAQDEQMAYAYLRRDEKSAFLVVLNLGNARATLHLDLGPTTLPTGQYRAVDVFTKKEWPVTDLSVTLDLDSATGAMLRLAPR